MQKGIRIMAVVSAALAATSLVLLFVSVPLQRGLIGLFLSAGDWMNDYLPLFPILPVVFCFLRTGAMALLPVCCGNKRGGIWLEVLVLVVLVAVLPVANYLASIVQTNLMMTMRGEAYMAVSSAVDSVATYCMIPAGLGQALACVACGMSIAYKKEQRA